MYDTKGTGYASASKPTIFTTPFSDQPQYNQRAGVKPFNVSKYPSTGNEWYARRAPNIVDLQTAMDQVLPDQQVQNWSRTKTVILQNDKPKKEGYTTKETAKESKLAEEIKELKKQHKKNKEGYITSPFGHAEDLWSAAGRIQDFGEAEKFTVMGKNFEIIDIIIVIVVIVIIVVAFWIFIQKYNQKKQEQEQEEEQEEEQFEDNEDVKTYPATFDFDKHEELSNENTDKTQNTQDTMTDNDEKPLLKENGGDTNVVNCGSLEGGAAFDKKIVI
jgi:uncharacterized membrane protein YcjF (UPF0283 family)